MVGLIPEGNRTGGRLYGFSSFHVAAVARVFVVVVRSVAVGTRLVGNMVTVVLRTSVTNSCWSVSGRLVVRGVSISETAAVKLRLAKFEDSDHSGYYDREETQKLFK